MNSKQYRIWMVLLENPGEWHRLGDIAYRTNLTTREIMSFLPMMEGRGVVKVQGPDEKNLIRLDRGPEDCARLRRDIIGENFGITEEMRTLVGSFLDHSWKTVADLMESTGMRKAEIMHTLETMEEVECLRKMPFRYRLGAV